LSIKKEDLAIKSGLQILQPFLVAGIYGEHKAFAHHQ